MPKKRKRSLLENVTRRRSTRPNIGKIGAALNHNAGAASMDAWRILHEFRAIDQETHKVKDDFHYYPPEMTGIKKCHLRAFFNISPYVSKKLLSEKVVSDNYQRVKEIFNNHVPQSSGRFFRLRNKVVDQQHWVAVTPEIYFDDAYYFKVMDYDCALHILQLLEAPESVFGGLESYIKNHVEAKSPEVNVIRGGGLSEDASAAKASGRKRKAAGSEKQTANGGEQIEQASSDKKIQPGM